MSILSCSWQHPDQSLRANSTFSVDVETVNQSNNSLASLASHKQNEYCNIMICILCKQILNNVMIDGACNI